MPNERSFGPRPSVPFLCLPHLLEHQARRIPDAPAILAPGRAPLTYGRLYQHIEEMERRLRAMGIGRRDRIAVVLPNGPEMAVAILTVAASAACAPLNPAYGAEELDRYFADLRPSCVDHAGWIRLAGAACGARRAASASSSCRPRPTRRPVFSRSPETKRVQPSDEPVSPSDVALLLPTSGTTSRPKIVPLTHANMCASAYAHAAALALRETDRCLNVMPLFHGHGLHRHGAGLAGGRRECRVHPRIRRQPLLCLANHVSTDVVLRRADHASGNSRPGSAQSRASGGLPATLRPLLVGSAAAPRLRGTRASFRGSA